ncbi:AraC family transcriptional regulator [Paenibacillus cymbidii]|uniref:AraC family transcriptional regulator n=1 Tax=Paenibacillus cymbidii TaxID=1639034 RepID=UPI0010808880|nr:AraC family transcriptional regulator [Paenibacillus cymbidii]
MRNNWSLHPMGYVFWREKAQFLLERDTHHFWTMFAVESGRFAYRIGSHAGEAAFGDIVVCPSGIPFHRRTITPLSFHFMQFVWEQEPGADEAASLGGKWTIRDTDRLASTYRYMREIGGGVREEPAFGRIKHMLEDVWRLVEIERSAAAEEAPPEDGGPEPDMLQARQWLLEHAYAPFSMRALSDLLGLSPVQLTRRFRAAFRATPSDFVTGLRLGRASRLLEETTLPLEAIAQLCGYENGFYLSRVFRAKLGTTPSAHRKLHRV